MPSQRNRGQRTLTPLVLMSLALMACGDDDHGGDEDNLVIVAGAVYNIDTGELARGAVVSLLGAEEAYHSDPTGEDGLFFLEVPRGTSFRFVTNDFAGFDIDTVGTGRRVANEWITMINVEPVLSSIDEDLEVVVHACPTPESSQNWKGGTANLGSVAIWKNFLEHSEHASEYTNATDVWRKVVVLAHAGTPANEDLGFPISQITNVAVHIQESSFGKIGYWSFERCFNLQYPGLEGQAVQDPAVGPDIFVSGARANGPGISLSTAFGNTDYTDDTVTLRLTDTDSARGIDFSGVNPIVLPVRDGATTMLMLGSVDNRVSSLTEGFCAAGQTQVGCD